VKGLSSMATRQLLGALVEEAVAAGLPALAVESVGGVDAAERVAAGEEVDLVFLADGALAKLAGAGHVDAATVTPLVLSRVAVALASGTDAPAAPVTALAYPDAEGLRAALRAATRIGYSTGPSGTALVRMIEEWGMTDELGDRLVQARPGQPVATLLAEGEVDLGLQQYSELVGVPGVRILGMLPPDCAIETVFSGAVATRAEDPAAASAVLEFFASEARHATVVAQGFDAP